MRTFREKTRNFDIYVEEFRNKREFLDSFERPENYWSEKTFVPDKDIKWFIRGWDEKTQEIKQETKLNSNPRTLDKKFKQKITSVTGYSCKVGQLLKGNPNCMRRTKKKLGASKIVEIYFDPGAVSNVSADRIMRHGVEVLKKINELELMGFRCKLWLQGYKGNERTRNCYFVRVPLKDENQPLDISNIAYALANDGMLRKLCFKWYEHIPNAEYISGYGRSIQAWEYNEPSKRDELLGAITPKTNHYYINLNTNMDTIFNDLTGGKK